MLQFLTALARTGVPYLWGGVVTWLAARGLLVDVLATISDPAWQGAVVTAVVTAISTGVYALVRLIEAKLPPLLARVLPVDVAGAVARVVLVLLIGVPTPPVYPTGSPDKL